MAGLSIRGGLIVSGFDEPPYEGTIDVVGDRIVDVIPGPSDDATAGRPGLDGLDVVDASGMIVCPGFIDAHVHGEQAGLSGRPVAEATRQGVTTYIVGQDGCSFAPGSATWIEYVNQYFGAVNGRVEFAEPSLSIAAFLDLVDRRTSVNIATLVPNGNLRFDAMGLSGSEPTRSELAEMASALARGLADGAVGLSSGMDYVPSRSAGIGEMASLASVLVDADAVYVSHLRGYGNRVGQGLEPDAIADIAIIDPTAVTDVSTYEQPRELSRGVRHVFVSGVPVLRDGELTGATPGRAIRKG
jgi:N-acyl-D-amino-acid deacylase